MTTALRACDPVWRANGDWILSQMRERLATSLTALAKRPVTPLPADQIPWDTVAGALTEGDIEGAVRSSEGV